MRAFRFMWGMAMLLGTLCLPAQAPQDPAELLAKGDAAGAQKASEAMFAFDPHNAVAHYYEARSLYAQGKPFDMIGYIGKYKADLTSLTKQQRETLDAETIYALYRIKSHPKVLTAVDAFCKNYPQSTSTSLMRGMATLAGFDVAYKHARDAKNYKMPMRLDGSTSGSAQWDNAQAAVRTYLEKQTQTTLTQMRFDPAAVPPTRLRENRWRASALLKDPKMFEADIAGADAATQKHARFVHATATFELYPERLGDIMGGIVDYERRFPKTPEALDLKRQASKQVFERGYKLISGAGATGPDAEKLNSAYHDEGLAYFSLFRDIASMGLIGTSSTLSKSDRAEVEYQFMLALPPEQASQLSYYGHTFSSEYPEGSPQWGSLKLWEARGQLAQPTPDYTIAAEILDNLLAKVDPSSPQDRGTTPWSLELRASVAKHFKDTAKITELLHFAEQLPDERERKQAVESIQRIAQQP